MKPEKKHQIQKLLRLTSRDAAPESHHGRPELLIVGKTGKKKAREKLMGREKGKGKEREPV